jgi:hypothetical protein
VFDAGLRDRQNRVIDASGGATMSQQGSAIERAALDYAARGWSVIPMEPRGKRPVVAWQDYQRHAATAARVAAWFRRRPEANVGIVTGAVSGFVVLDVDPGHGGTGSLRELERAHGGLPPTVEALTGGGGRHLYFLHPGSILHNRAGLLPGIDVRGDGGCVVAPPSIHPSGTRYAWREGRGPDELPLAVIPSWLLSRLRADDPRAGHPREYWRELAERGVVAGQRNNTIASFTGHLLWHGVDPEVALDLLLAWNRVRCQPPLSDEEVAHTVQSITRLHARDDDAGG